MAGVKVDALLPAGQQLTDLIAKSTHTRHDRSNLTFGLPHAADLNDPPATLVDLVASNSYFNITRQLSYRRANLTEAFRYQAITVQVGEPPLKAAVVAAVNALGLTQLVEGEVEMDIAPGSETGTYTAQLTALAGSLLYIGGLTVLVTTEAS